jgi:hypothetical protein
VGFEPTISAGERPKNYALDRAATAGTGAFALLLAIYCLALTLRKEKWQLVKKKSETLISFKASFQITKIFESVVCKSFTLSTKETTHTQI